MSQFFLALTNESYVPEVPSADFEDEVSIYSTFEPDASLASLSFRLAPRLHLCLISSRLPTHSFDRVTPRFTRPTNPKWKRWKL